MTDLPKRVSIIWEAVVFGAAIAVLVVIFGALL